MNGVQEAASSNLATPTRKILDSTRKIKDFSFCLHILFSGVVHCLYIVVSKKDRELSRPFLSFYLINFLDDRRVLFGV